jgi:hypothetical protein
MRLPGLRLRPARRQHAGRPYQVNVENAVAGARLLLRASWEATRVIGRADVATPAQEGKPRARRAGKRYRPGGSSPTVICSFSIARRRRVASGESHALAVIPFPEQRPAGETTG